MHGINLFRSKRIVTRGETRLRLAFLILLLITVGISRPSMAASVPTEETHAPKSGAKQIGGKDLNSKVTLKVNSLSIDEFLKEIRKQTGIAIEASDTIKNKMLTATLRNRSVKEILDGLRNLFGYSLWYYQKTDRYVLYAGVHDQWIEDIKAKQREDLKGRMAETQAALAKDPKIGEPVNVIQRTFAFLKSEDMQTLLNKNSVQLPFSALNAKDQEGLRSFFSNIRYGSNGEDPHPPTEQDINGSIVTFFVDEDGGNLYLRGGFKFKGLGSAFTVVPPPTEVDPGSDMASPRLLPGDFDKKTREAFADAIEFFKSDDDAAGRRKDSNGNPLLKKKIRVMFPEINGSDEFSGEYNDPLSPTDLIFHAIADQAGTDFIADSYLNCCLASNPSFGGASMPKDIRDQPLGEAMDGVSKSLKYEWDLHNSFILFRNPRWYAEESKEPPVDISRRWVRYWHLRKDIAEPLSVKEVATLAASLTQPQLQVLGKVNPIAERISGAAGPFALYLTLSEKDRKRMDSDQGIAWADLSEANRQTLFTRIPDDAKERVTARLKADPDARFRIQVRDEQIRSEFSVNGVWKLDIVLPTQWKTESSLSQETPLKAD